PRERAGARGTGTNDNPNSSEVLQTSAQSPLHVVGLDAYRPLAERVPDPQVAEAQRKEFFGQLHRWSHQGYAVHVFCNNEGERQRFRESWDEYGESPESKVPPSPEGSGEASQGPKSENELEGASRGALSIHLGALARGFLSDQARVVVVTDAEIFGRYKVQR